MKKILFVIFALLLTIGVANATNIPQMVDPKNYPTVWTELVYNGSGSDIVTGKVVVWDIAASDVDVAAYDGACMWVKVAATAHSVWTAGVTTIARESGVSSDIAISNGNVGRIIIRGPAVVHNNNSAPTVNTIISTTSAGYVGTYTPAADTASLGVVIKASAATNDIEADVGAGSSLIWINPTLNDQ